MTQANPRSLLLATGALGRALDSVGARFMLIGGVAVIARGVVRLTGDVDAKVSLGEQTLESVLEALATHGICPRIAGALEFARQHQVLLLRHEPTSTPVDLALAWLPFELDSLERAERLDFEGVLVPTATVEDLLVSKAVAWRGRDKDDIERLLVLHGGKIDLPSVLRWVREFAELLECPERITEFALIVERARGTR